MNTTTNDNVAAQFVSVTLSGDLGTKIGNTRWAFHRQLRANIKATLARHGYSARLRDRRDRIDLEGVDAGAVEPLSRVFGIRAVRFVTAMPWRSLEDIVAAGERLYGDTVAGRTFAVRPRRVGSRNQIGVSSEALARELGSRLVQAGGAVDLDHPAVRLRVEVRPRDVLFFHDNVEGPGGLPIGIEGRALALISGGFDSAVAAWEMLRRGVHCDFVLFNLAGAAQEEPVRRVLHRLDNAWMAGADARLYVVDFRPIVAEMRQRVPAPYWQVLLKRLMMRSADEVAEMTGARALITGEALGQVSSQTLANLSAVTARAATPVLRPLLGRDKHEIVALAHHIGTAEISATVEEFCALNVRRPLTHVRAGELDQQEQRIDPALISTLARRAREVPSSAFGDAVEGSPELERVPEHVAVVDVRSEAEHREWHWPDAIHMGFDKAMAYADRLPRDRAYLFYCEVGLKSAYLAQIMREAGFEAYSFRGGAGPMQQYAERLQAQTPLRA